MRILHTSITVKNMEESIRFYRDVMGLELQSKRERAQRTKRRSLFSMIGRTTHRQN